MKSWTFDTDPKVPLVGYRRVGDANYAKYARFKRYVRLVANLAGMPYELPDKGAAIMVTAQWKKRQRYDATEILKAMEDGLFAKDRRFLGSAYMGYEDQGVERARVTVSFKE